MTVTIYVVETTFYGPGFTDRQYPIAFFDDNLAKEWAEKEKKKDSNPSMEYAVIDVELYVGEEVAEENL